MTDRQHWAMQSRDMIARAKAVHEAFGGRLLAAKSSRRTTAKEDLVG